MRRALAREHRLRPLLVSDQRTLLEREDDVRRLGVHKARSIQLLVRVVPVAPAVGEPLTEPALAI
jgi:hypothetical protein